MYNLSKGFILGMVMGIASCASIAAATAPALENRTLLISADIPGFEYPYAVCTKWFIGICTHNELHKDYYDLTKLEVRKQLIDMNFIAEVRIKP